MRRPCCSYRRCLPTRRTDKTTWTREIPTNPVSSQDQRTCSTFCAINEKATRVSISQRHEHGKREFRGIPYQIQSAPTSSIHLKTFASISCTPRIRKGHTRICMQLVVNQRIKGHSPDGCCAPRSVRCAVGAVGVYSGQACVVVCVHVRQPFFSTLRIQPLHGCSVNVGHDLLACESCHRVKSWTHILISPLRGDIQFLTSSAMTKNRGSAGLGKVCGAS